MCKQEELHIVPIARPFFALCDPRTGIPLSPYHTLTQDEAKKKYQLRVFVNTGENSFQFLKMSKVAYFYYYRQVRGCVNFYLIKHLCTQALIALGLQ